MARAPFWVREAGTRPSVKTDKASYAAGEPIIATWDNAPGNRFDWLGIYAQDDPADDNYQYFFYVNSAVAGSMTLDKDLFDDVLPAGDYDVRLMRDDAYMRLAGSSFTVK